MEEWIEVPQEFLSTFYVHSLNAVWCKKYAKQPQKGKSAGNSREVELLEEQEVKSTEAMLAAQTLQGFQSITKISKSTRFKPKKNKEYWYWWKLSYNIHTFPMWSFSKGLWHSWKGVRKLDVQ